MFHNVTFLYDINAVSEYEKPFERDWNNAVNKDIIFNFNSTL